MRSAIQAQAPGRSRPRGRLLRGTPRKIGQDVAAVFIYVGRRRRPQFLEDGAGMAPRIVAGLMGAFRCVHGALFRRIAGAPADGSLAVVAACLAGAPGLGTSAGHAEPLRAGSAGQEHAGDARRMRLASDNFTVLHAKISKPFRDQFPPEKLRRGVQRPDRQARRVRRRGGQADRARRRRERSTSDGVLRLKGHFETTPKQVKYQLGFIPSDGALEAIGGHHQH